MPNLPAALKSTWISTGKKWSDSPPQVKGMVKSFFKVPIDNTSKIYPAKNLSMKQMMDFTIPCPAQSLFATTANPASYFSQVAPSPITDVLLTWLCHLPIPLISIVNKLCEVGNQVEATPVLAASGCGCHKKYGATRYEGADWESH